MERFACELRELRASADGVTYREMARRAAYSASALSMAAAGEQLPSLAVVLAYVAVCGGDAGEWADRWHRTAEEMRARDAVKVVDDEEAKAPYRGLARFEPDDREVFFGRGQLATDLLNLVSEQRVVMLTGASGSGKSSLLRAGLVPLLRNPPDGTKPWCAGIRILTPGARPASQHAPVLRPRESAVAVETDTVVMVDQFEELFTLCRDQEERRRFLDLLLAARDPVSGMRIVIGVRADFYGHCTEYPELVEVLRRAHLPVGSMSPAELRQAVIGPARAAGLIVERELTARIVEEASGEQGALPLMSHALLEVWRRRRGRTLTLAAYEAVGGLHGAITDTAEHTYHQLTGAQKPLAREILLRLINPGQGAPDTRRPAPGTELKAVDQAADTVVERLARARLITLNDDSVDLAHEALITAWPRLHTWIDEERSRLVIHRKLTVDAATWNELDHDPGALYRGTLLATTREVFAGNHDRLTAQERDFLTASVAALEHEEQAAARTGRLLRRLASALAVLLVLALTAGTIAWRQSRASDRERDRALQAQRIGQSRQLAVQSAALIDSNPDLAALLALHAHRAAPTREAVSSVFNAAELPLRNKRHAEMDMAGPTAFSPDLTTLAYARSAHETLLYGTLRGKQRIHHSASVAQPAALAYSPDGARLASGNRDGTVTIRDAATGRLRATLIGHRHAVVSVAFSADGAKIATASDDTTIRLWSARTGRPLAVLTGHTGEARGRGRVNAVTFSPDGSTVASSGEDGTVRLWNSRNGGHRILTTNALHVTHARTTIHPDMWPTPDYTSPVAFSPDGRTLATSHQDGTVRLWNAADRTPGHVLRGHAEKARWAVFSPDGRTLATADDGSSTIRLWDVGTGALRTTFTGHEDVITALAFSPDSSTLATTGRDQTIRRWAAAPAQQRIFAGHTGSVVALALSKDGSTLATSSLDTTVRLWSARSGASRLTLTRVSAALALSPDGRTVATTNPERNVVHLRSALTGRTRLALPHPRKGAFVVLAFSPDGRTLATISERNSDINLWSTATGRLQRTVVSPNGDIAGLSFSPDGQVLATVSDNSRDISLWNAATGRLVRGFSGPSPHSAFLAFSPDGKTLATSDAEGPVRLWDTTTGRHRIFMGATRKVAVLAFSPDGRTLATGDDQAHDVKLWDTATGALRRTHQGSRESFLSATFRPDGKAIAVGYAKSVGLWNVDLPDESSAVNRLCQAFNRTPTREERNQYPIGPDPCPEDAPRPSAQGYGTYSGALEGEGRVDPGRFRLQRATTPSHPPSPASSARPTVRRSRPISSADRRRSDAEGPRRPSDIGRMSGSSPRGRHPRISPARSPSVGTRP